MTHEGAVRVVVDEFNPDFYVYHRFFYTHEHRWLNISTWYFSCQYICTFIFAYFFQTSADTLTAVIVVHPLTDT